MTIKQTANNNNNLNASPEPDIDLSSPPPAAAAAYTTSTPDTAPPSKVPESSNYAANEPEVPVAFANVLDEKPQQAAAPPSGGSHAVTATTPAPPGASTFAGRPIPPNAPPGGQWVRVKYAGNSTWGIIAGTCCILCCFCAIITGPCALFGLLCPCDEKVAYMSPNGVIYDEQGKAIGDTRRSKYVVLQQA